MKIFFIQTILLVLFINATYAQNSMVGDGFGGRLWYSPTNYTVGSYSGYSVCYNSTPNQLYGWGDNGRNQLGLGLSILGVNVPTQIPNMTNVKYFSTGYIMGAIKNDNTGWAWGQVLNGNPIQVLTNVKFVDASFINIGYVKNDGTVWSVGDNSNGQFGNGTINTGSFSSAIQMQSITNAVRVANNSSTTIVLLSDSTLMAVGSDNGGGYLGLGISTSQTLLPLPINGLPPIIDIKSNTNGTVALATNGNVYFWGTDINLNIAHSPTLIPNLTNIVAISGCDDGRFFLALDENKNCYAWGENGWGQLGISINGNPTATPQIVATDVIDIMAGETFSYLIKSDGSLWASGSSKVVSGSSIWLNLPDIQRNSFTQLDPSVVPEACAIVGDNIPTPPPIPEPIPPQKEPYITFSNVFSPNHDGENDLFYFPNEGVTEMYCKIYNRWGNLVYEFNQVNESWNGRTNSGKECSEGTYFYIVYYKMGNSDWETAKSYLTLLR